MFSSLYKKALLFFLVICLVCSISFCVNGQDITLSPSSITVEMIGGDTIDVDITARQDSGYDLICNIGYSILPDDIGINVSFSVGDTFLLCSGDDVIIIVTINASHAIMPGIYTIDIYVNAERETKGDFSKPPSDDLGDDGDDVIPDDEVNETPDDTLLVDDNPPDSDTHLSFMYHHMVIILIVILITILITLLVLYWIRRRKKKNEN